MGSNPASRAKFFQSSSSQKTERLGFHGRLNVTVSLDRSRFVRDAAEKWQRGRMHTPAKGAGPNKGLGGSNPPFSAINMKPRALKVRGFLLSSFRPFLTPAGVSEVFASQTPPGASIVNRRFSTEFQQPRGKNRGKFSHRRAPSPHRSPERPRPRKQHAPRRIAGRGLALRSCGFVIGGRAACSPSKRAPRSSSRR